MSEKEKKNKRLGLIISGTFHVIVILLLFAFTLTTDEEKEEPAIIIMDFSSGSSSKGGASSEPAPSETVTEEPTSNTDPVITQETKSPIVKSTKPKSTSSSTQSSTPAKKPNTNALANGAFNGNGSGQNDGNGNGNNDGIGDGINGPGVTGKIGSLGSGDGIPPRVTNPTRDQEGVVMIELTVDRQGKVIDVKVLSSHPRTTTTDPELLNQAKKDGFRFQFKPDSRRAEFSKGVRGINYILQ